MESTRFDALIRRLGSDASRRTVLGLVAVLGFGPQVGEGKKRKKKKKSCKKKKCGACQVCRKGKCLAGPDGAACGEGNLCDAGTCRAPRCGDPGTDCLVFISSTRHTGNLGGLAGADAICQDLADAAGLDGTFLAWISDGEASPASRFPTKATGAYRLLNGTKIADNWEDLTDGTLDEFIYVPDTGEDVYPGPGDPAWTGTLPNGQATTPNCDNWTSADAADSGVSGYHRRAFDEEGLWTFYQQPTCNAELRLYCFQQS